jgi:hypothetical protein
MAQWIKANPLPLFFLVSLAGGLTLIAAGLFTISVTVGLIGTGILLASAGHWLTYLKTLGGTP